jgi:hypothetical protein
VIAIWVVGRWGIDERRELIVPESEALGMDGCGAYCEERKVSMMTARWQYYRGIYADAGALMLRKGHST